MQKSLTVVTIDAPFTGTGPVFTKQSKDVHIKEPDDQLRKLLEHRLEHIKNLSG